jgi:hypothetical protein
MRNWLMIILVWVSGCVFGQICMQTDVQNTAVIFSLNDSIKESEHEFSFDTDKKVHFALGNLQYNPSTGELRLAPQQFDYVGGGYGGDTYLPSGEYGTMYINGVKCWNIQYGSPLTGNRWIDAFNFDDIYNLIGRRDTFYIDGKMYRIPTKDEISYLVFDRPNANQLRARVQITLNTPTQNGNTFINGLLLLPDDWDPKVWIGTTIIPDLDGVIGCWYYYDNIITEGEWYILEAQGAVFFPAAGNPTGRGNSKYNRSGFYWTTTPDPKYPTTKMYSLEFGGYPWEKDGKPNNSTPSLERQSKTFRRTIRLCREINE